MSNYGPCYFCGKDSCCVTGIKEKSYIACDDCTLKAESEHELLRPGSHTWGVTPIDRPLPCEICDRVNAPSYMHSAYGWHVICGHKWCVNKMEERRKTYDGVRP